MSASLFLVVAGTAARRALADRGALLVAVAFYAVIIVTLGALWRAAAEAGGGSVAGYSAVALTWYIAVSEAAATSIPIRLIEEVGDDVASGSVASELLRPASVLGVRLATEVGRTLPRLAGFLVVAAVTSVVVAGGPPRPAALLLAVPSLLLAVVANLAGQHAFAGAAFWLRDVRSTWFLYQKLVFILGGMLLPLEVLPAWLERVASALPFMAMAYAPARLAAGHVEPGLLVVQAGWTLVLLWAASAVFVAGERRLQVVGG